MGCEFVMEIIKISGRSGFIKGGTNTGTYVFEDGSVLLIDAGHSVQRGARIAKFLEKNELVPKYMYTTHEHFDHFEATAGIKQEYPEAKLIAHRYAKPYIENLYLGMAYLSSSAIPSFFGRRNNGLSEDLLVSDQYSVDIVVEDRLDIGGESFEIVHLPGHCAGQAAIITPDRVCYLGDVILDPRIIDTYDMPFLFSITLHERSLAQVKELDFDYGLIGHSKSFYSKEEIIGIVDQNLAVIERYEQDIVALLDKPITREEILAALMTKNQVDCTYSSYHYNNSTVGAFLAKLSHQERIDFRYEQGKIWYYLRG